MTLPQLLFATLKRMEWEHHERVWALQSRALAAAAGFGSKEAGRAIERYSKRPKGRTMRTFGEILDEELKKRGG